MAFAKERKREGRGGEGREEKRGRAEKGKEGKGMAGKQKANRVFIRHLKSHSLPVRRVLHTQSHAQEKTSTLGTLTQQSGSPSWQEEMNDVWL